MACTGLKSTLLKSTGVLLDWLSNPKQCSSYKETVGFCCNGLAIPSVGHSGTSTTQQRRGLSKSTPVPQAIMMLPPWNRPKLRNHDHTQTNQITAYLDMIPEVPLPPDFESSSTGAAPKFTRASPSCKFAGIFTCKLGLRGFCCQGRCAAGRFCQGAEHWGLRAFCLSRCGCHFPCGGLLALEAFPVGCRTIFYSVIGLCEVSGDGD